MLPTDEGGDDNIENAIPVCFECHAEIHSYNDKHPRGRKFQPDELRLHKEQWLRTCAEHPEALAAAARAADVGPLQALIDELEFNATVAVASRMDQGCKFLNHQFLRAVQEGSISILQDEIRELLLSAYHAMGAANGRIEAVLAQARSSGGYRAAFAEAQRLITEAGPKIAAAKQELLKFLSSDALA
jgi:hypothetical protein